MLSITTPARHKKVNCLMIQASRIIFLYVDWQDVSHIFSLAIKGTHRFYKYFLYSIHNYTYIHYIYIYNIIIIIRIIRLGLWGNCFLIFLKIHIIFFTSVFGSNVGFLSMHFWGWGCFSGGGERYTKVL